MTAWSKALTVVAIPWLDEDSGQSTVEFCGPLDQRFRAFSDGFVFKVGEKVDVALGFLDLANDFRQIFEGNPQKRQTIEPGSEWDCRAFGQVTEVGDGTMMVDCGGVYFTVDGLTKDERVIGEWVRLELERVEVLEAAKA